MIQWRFDDLRQEHFSPWFVPPPPPQLVFSKNNSPMNSFFDYIYPVVDRLSPSFNGEKSFDYLHSYINRPLRLDNSVIRPNKIAKTFSREYEILSCLGKGGFGQVFDGRRRSNSSSVVVKILLRDRILNWGTFLGKRVPYEIELLWRFRGVPGIIRIFEHFEEPDRFIFTMEKIPNSSTLFDFVTASSPLANTELLRHIFRELVRINITLQNYGVWHRDCKPENVLYCETDRSLRFIDFGSAAPVQVEDFREFQGTLEIMVPEWILEKRYNGEQSCVWTLGVCLYFLLFQQYPFRSKADIVNGRSRLPFIDSSDTEAYQTMKQCLHRHGHRRPRLNSLLQLSWLN